MHLELPGHNSTEGSFAFLPVASESKFARAISGLGAAFTRFNLAGQNLLNAGGTPRSGGGYGFNQTRIPK
jgi:hypothetical protein